jgi:hypothetical protein
MQAIAQDLGVSSDGRCTSSSLGVQLKGCDLIEAEFKWFLRGSTKWVFKGSLLP